ncbi:hypothetical protein DM02DRAFT_510181 [Periconia macrospinosa]|uniref:S-adenosyl-L-methionine-dependent methyltransferase n=1 Tax=Periconia macrospinosa TaxID=97972 RepID=A0A2V1EEI6_9PLEO|nr:hypothetical protein DM02DRAFT_510181 [Periconia macrospinosa]
MSNTHVSTSTPSFDALSAQIAGYSLNTQAQIQKSQARHRLNLVREWKIPIGSRVLEIGCGEGDCTVALAYAVGDKGTVVAVDPSRPNSGFPVNLATRHRFISEGPLGPRITWVEKTALEYLSSLSRFPDGSAKLFDVAVLSHSLWYFESPQEIIATLEALRQYCNRLHIAEWSLSTSDPAAQPHILAALTRAALDCHKPLNMMTNRMALDPQRIMELANEAGWRLQSDAILTNLDPRLPHAALEVNYCLSRAFYKEICAHVSDARKRAAVLAVRDACEVSWQAVPDGVRGVKPMDVWVGTLYDGKKS